MAKVGLVFGGRSTEHKVSISSARTVDGALRAGGHEVVPIGVAEDGGWLDAAVSQRALAGGLDRLQPSDGAAARSVGPLLEASPDVVFPILHGTWGEDGTVQGLCEMLDLPYVGAGVTASAVAMDKRLAKTVLAAAGVSVVPWVTFDRSDAEDLGRLVIERLPGLAAPWFVKPSVGGSSVGVRRVEHVDGLAPAIAFALEFDDCVLVEKGIVGRELECSVLGYRRLEASVVGEILPSRDFYDYADKYLLDRAGLVVPAELDAELQTSIRGTAVEAFAAIGGSGMARVDFLLSEDGALYVNEINTLPGFTDISMYPKLWQAAGLGLPDLVDRLIEIALARHRDRGRLDASIKAFLAQLEA